MQLNPKKIIGTLGRRYGGKPFQKVRAAYYDTIRLSKDLIGTTAVAFKKKAPWSLDEEVDSKLYHDRNEKIEKNGVIVMLDGAIHHGGLTDRIRGILTVYRECKKRNLPFYILWNDSFNLADYLLPSTFDWRISEEEISRSRKNSRPVVIDDMNPRQSLWRLKAALASPPRQLHLYTNADSAKGDYAELFPLLFRPAPKLQASVDFHKERLGKDYWSFTFRFLTLLGDFKDWLGITLNTQDQDKLISKVIEEFKKVIADIPPGIRIHITSDSTKFLKRISNVDSRVYIVEGDIQNIDLDKSENENAWLKTFTDQQLIMGAHTVVRMRTDKMYATGFARFAAEVGKARFIDHVF